MKVLASGLVVRGLITFSLGARVCMQAEGTALSSSAALPRIGGCYELHHPLGRGGMGTVWQALDVRSGRHVAIKRLHHDSPEATRRLTRELQALARLQHPNLVQVLDSGV